MTRHLIIAFGLALVAAATALLLADAGVFEGMSRWLFDRYRAESLWKGDPSPAWPWLQPVASGVIALMVAWVAVDLVSGTAKVAVLGASLIAVAFLSLTLAFYGSAYSPWPALTAAVLAFAMGTALAETPSSREQRETVTLLGTRAGPATLAAWSGRGLTAPWQKPGLREAAVVSVRLLSPAPPAETIGLHLDQRARVLGELVRLLRGKPGVILDPPASDGLRAFFGFRPDTAAGDIETAAQTALEIATFLKDEAELQTQAGVPSLVWGIGLSFGPLVVGNHGPETERFWTASGTPAEQARQLAALNARHHTTILIGRRAADTLSARFEVRAVEGDAIHALVAMKPDTGHEELPLTPPDPDTPAGSAAA